MANGKEPPLRSIEGHATLLGRSIHAIEYDHVHDEIFVPQRVGGAILVFRGAATGEEPPIRVIQGSRTLLRNSDRLAIDPIHNELFVPDDDKVLVFARDANGDVAPIRILEGPDTQLGASAVAIDPTNDLLVVTGNYRARGSKSENVILTFKRTDQGNVKPRSVIKGPQSMLDGGTRNIRVQGPWIIAAHDGVQGDAPTKFEAKKTARSYVGVWNINDNGDVAPRWTIGGPQGLLAKPRGVAVNARNKEVIVSDKDLNAVMTYSFPELFDETKREQKVTEDPRPNVSVGDRLFQRLGAMVSQLASSTR
jgi:hypothetical protein